MKRSNRILLSVASALLASLLLSGCGSGGSGMSDDDKVNLMHKAHDAPLSSGKAATPGAAPTTGGTANPLAHP